MRLGRNKLFEYIDNKSLLERVISRLSSFKSDIIIVTRQGQSIPQLSYLGLRLVADIYSDKGALGGIYTGLVASNSFYNLVVACDMPFLNQALLGYMIALSPGFDVVIPRLGDLVEPLHAIYSKGCLVPMERLLKEGNLKVNDILPLVRVRYVEAEEMDKFDLKRLSLFNINTQADLVKARELAKKEMSDVKH